MRDKEQSQLKRTDVWKEITTPGYLDRARARARKRKSPWNLVLVPLIFGGIAGITYFLFHLMWSVHVSFYPEHAGRLAEFWQDGLSLRSFISSFLLLIPLFFAAIPISMMLANCIGWCIPPARRAFDPEGQTEKWLSFPVAMRQLGRASLIIVPICLALSLLGAATLVHLR